MKISAALATFYQKVMGIASPFVMVLLLLTSSVVVCLPSESTNRIKHDQRPTALEYSLMSQHAYDSGLKVGQEFSELPGWKIHRVNQGNGDYSSVVFKNVDTRQVVIAYRGTVPSKLGNLYEDFKGIFLGQISPHKLETFKSIKMEIKNISEYTNEERYGLSFTGHSLGAFLAELSVFFCHNSFNYPDASATTFESPGSLESMEALQSNLQHKIPLENLDIISYVGTPNVINTLNRHVGSLYQIEYNLGELNSNWNPVNYTLKCHSMDSIVVYFKNNASGRDGYNAYYMSDWPLNTILQGQKSAYFSQAQWDKIYNCYRLPSDIEEDGSKLFDLTYQAHYQTQKQLDHSYALSLRHFGIGMQNFLCKYYDAFTEIVENDNSREELFNVLSEGDFPEKIISYLTGFSVVKVKNDYVITLLNTASYDVHDFRRELSEYLQKNENIQRINSQLGSINKKNNQLEIDVAVAEKGSRVGEIKNPVVIGIDAALNGVNDDFLIKTHREQQMKFIKKLKETNVKVRVRVAEDGSDVGKIDNARVTGVDVSVDNRNYECDSQGNNCKDKSKIKHEEL